MHFPAQLAVQMAAQAPPLQDMPDVQAMQSPPANPQRVLLSFAEVTQEPLVSQQPSQAAAGQTPPQLSEAPSHFKAQLAVQWPPSTAGWPASAACPASVVGLKQLPLTQTCVALHGGEQVEVVVAEPHDTRAKASMEPTIDFMGEPLESVTGPCARS